MSKGKGKKDATGGKKSAGESTEKVEHPRSLGSGRKPTTDRALTSGRTGGSYDTKG